MCCSVMQCVAVCCSLHECRRQVEGCGPGPLIYLICISDTLSCNTLQLTAVHCTTRQHTATNGNTPQHAATQGHTRISLRPNRWDAHTHTHANTHTLTHIQTNTHSHTHMHGNTQTLPRSSIYAICLSSTGYASSGCM